MGVQTNMKFSGILSVFAATKIGNQNVLADGHYEWMNECVFKYRTYHVMSHGGLQFYWVKSDVCL